MPHNTVTVVLGKKGSGKSTLVGEIIQDEERVWVIDSLAEYGKDRGLEVYTDFESCVEAIQESAGRDRFRLSLRVLSEEENLDLIGLCYEAAGDINERGKTSMIVVEETSLYVKPNMMPDEIAKIVRYGRHRELDQVYVSRRPAELSRDLTANADVIVTFRTTEPRDLQYLSSYFSPEEIERIKGLRVWDKDSGPEQQAPEIAVTGDMSKAPSAVLARLAVQSETDSESDIDEQRS